ncbi:MAG: ParA family protein [Pseudomonadota bacterium]
MSFVLTIAQRKGGAGKTTIACHLTAALLADETRNVGSIDVDPQQSYTYWANLRRERLGDTPRHIHTAAEGFRAIAETRRLKRDADIVIIDAPPHNDTAARQAVRLADMVLIPMQLAPFDLAATADTARLVAQTSAAPLILFNRTPARSRIADEIRKRLADLNVPTAPVELGARTAYAESLLKGLGVTEAAPSSAAAKEMRQLTEYVLKQSAIMQKAA